MRIAIMGAGALGGFYGGLMARSGEDVTFIARGQTLAALRERGLTVRSKLAGEFTLPVAATVDPAAMTPVDLVFFGVKSYDLDEAAHTIQPLVGPETTVFSVLNGVDNGDRLAAILGQESVVDGAVYVSATIEEPAVIAQIGGPGLVRLGERGGPATPRIERLRALFERSGVKAIVHDDMRPPLWEKFMAICAMSGVSALTRLTLRQIFDCPESRAFYHDVMREVVTVGQALGVALPDTAADDMMSMLLGMPALPERGSMAYDLLAGRRLELDTLNGAVVRLGGEHGLATPYNRAIYAALKPSLLGAPVAA